MVNLLSDEMRRAKRFEAAYPMLYPWNDHRKEDAPRFIKKSNGWWHNPSARPTGKALVCCVGDLLCEPRLIRRHRYGDRCFFQPLFQFVRSTLRAADLSMGNLETTVTDLTPDAGDYHTVAGKYHCNAPESFLEALRYAGFDGVVNANNHNCDSGFLGLEQTLRRLDEHRFFHTGTFLPEQQDRAALVEVNGIRLGILSYATFFNRLESNFTLLGQDMLNPFSPDRAKEDIAWAKERGAEYILTYIHWGKEYVTEPNELQQAQAKALADAGADCIVGSHSHCLQSTAMITAADGRQVPVAYSLGNFITNESKDLCRHSGILQLHLEKTGDGIITRRTFVPCYIFDSFETTCYGSVPADPLLNGGFDHPKLQQTRQFSGALLRLPELKSCALTVPQLCELWGIDLPETMAYTAVSGICTRPEQCRERQLYFSMGNESKHQQLCLMRRRPVLIVTEDPSAQGHCLIVPDVKRAYRQLIAYLQPKISGKLIVVAGEERTITASMIIQSLERAYPCKADHDWLLANEEYNWCVQQMQPGDPFGYPRLQPRLCVITGWITDLEQLLESLGADTLVLYNAADSRLTQSLSQRQLLKKPYGIIDTIDPRFAAAAGAAAAVAEAVGAAAPERLYYTGMEKNLLLINGMQVITDYNCESEQAAKASLKLLKKKPGKRIAVVEDRYAAFAEADAVISLPQPSPERAERMAAELKREKQLLQALEPGCTVLLCGGRHMELNVTLRRVFGLTDGDVYDLT